MIVERDTIIFSEKNVGLAVHIDDIKSLTFQCTFSNSYINIDTFKSFYNIDTLIILK